MILLTKNARSEAEGLFDEIIEGDLLNSAFVQSIIPHLKKTYSTKGIISNYEHYVVVRSYLAERFGIPSSTVYSAACTRNKAMQRNALKYMKENIDHRVVKTEAQALSAFNALGGDVFIKSIAGIKSSHVFHVQSETAMRDAFTILKRDSGKIDEDLYNDYRYCDFNFDYPDPKHHFLVEKAIEGEQIGVTTLVEVYRLECAVDY
ncbi:hypothetical protein IPJ72_04700 [Candidatus Peregrinibacteria bacterium]|nr:MAG: hypothetical protein IPJ72_04700 [Candidatus Peregrinibacteria bacterium]